VNVSIFSGEKQKIILEYFDMPTIFLQLVLSIRMLKTLGEWFNPLFLSANGFAFLEELVVSPRLRHSTAGN
jgi:hypothetical protein